MDTRTLKKIYNKLSQEDKTELKSEKVELALIQDLERSYKIMKSLESDKSALKNKAIDETRLYRLKVAILKERADEVLNIIVDIENSAKEIGIDIPNNIQKQKTEAENISKTSEKLRNELQQALRNIN